MIENNENGRRIRQYFIEVEKRYKKIVETPTNIFDFISSNISKKQQKWYKRQN